MHLHREGDDADHHQRRDESPDLHISCSSAYQDGCGGESHKPENHGYRPNDGGKEYAKPSRFRAYELEDHVMVEQAEQQDDQYNDHQKLRKNVFECLPCFFECALGFPPVFDEGEDEQQSCDTVENGVPDRHV